MKAQENVILISIPVNELETLIIECVNTCLKHHSPPPPELSDLPELITRRQAAKMLSVSLGTLDAWAREGRLTKCRAGRAVRFRKSELLAGFKTLKESRYQRSTNLKNT